MLKASDLWKHDNRQLRAVLSQGQAIAPDELAGWEYRGVALGLPEFVEKLTWKTFVKTFYYDEKQGIIRGWNVRVEQDGLTGPSLARRKDGKVLSWGPYHVQPLPAQMPLQVRAGVLINYGPASPLLDGTHVMRDPLVALREDDPTELLGCSYAQIGNMQWLTPSWFTLTRLRPLTHVHGAGDLPLLTAGPGR